MYNSKINADVSDFRSFLHFTLNKIILSMYYYAASLVFFFNLETKKSYIGNTKLTPCYTIIWLIKVFGHSFSNLHSSMIKYVTFSII